MALRRFKGTVGNALMTILYDRLTSSNSIDPLPRSVRVEGKTCFITGASSGIGKALAVEMASRGANLILACRTGVSEIVEEVKDCSGSAAVEALHVDLADLDSVRYLCDELRERKLRVDIAVLNAGLSTVEARRSKQGFETMFAVHFLANRYLVKRLLEDGVINPNSEADSDDVPRLIFVSSEAHRSGESFDFSDLGTFHAFGRKDALRYYGISKMVLSTYVCELSKRLNPSDSISIAVQSLCPGAVATNIAREAPQSIQWLIGPFMRTLFRSPEAAICPIVYLACAPDAGRRTGIYLHVMQEKDVSPHASNPENGRMLWERSEKMLLDYEANTASSA
ncbi:MAG: SDR family NAD(P)-dependent oxidoreductase [Gammaproteobacteria bacterium]|nr:SDR family NAD(P)-dependent oxidoreductase [Gammaproteobacteria bacterium]